MNVHPMHHGIISFRARRMFSCLTEHPQVQKKSLHTFYPCASKTCFAKFGQPVLLKLKLVQTGKPQRYKNPTQKSPWFFRFAISPCRCVKMADVFALPMNNSKVIVRLFIGKAVHKKIKHLPHEPHEAGVRGVPAAETAVNDLRHPRSRICWCRLS